MRVAIQISAGDIPAGNGWCDFNTNLVGVSPCVAMATETRDIVQTVTCNGCHGTTTDTKLALHGGGRTDVEYCVTCHNPGSKDANSGNSVDFTVMIHKIHAGSTLANGYMIYGFRNTLHDYSNVNFTKQLDDCTGCHTGGGADEDNWSSVPTREACGSCHDDVNFDTGANHATGIVVPGNEFCSQCHPATNFPTAVEMVHHGAVRKTEADLYTGAGNGFIFNDVSLDAAGTALTIRYSVVRDGVPMDLDIDPACPTGQLERTRCRGGRHGQPRRHLYRGRIGAVGCFWNRGRLDGRPPGRRSGLEHGVHRSDFSHECPGLRERRRRTWDSGGAQ